MAQTAATPAGVKQAPDRHPGYPQEPKQPHRRCGGCGRFLCWDDYVGRYVDHTVYDGYVGGYEWTC
jgi:hypothetical protein